MSAPGPRACVIGWPVRHSRSPLIHGFWLAEHELQGDYTHAEIEPDDFADFVGSLEQNGFSGANVTIPFKEGAFALCDQVTPMAAKLRAVNTLWLADGRLHGDNTDAAGFLGSLDDQAPGWDHRLHKVVVLGAGGAARAVVHALGERNAGHVVITNRTTERARQLATAIEGSPIVELAGWEELPGAMEHADLLVNTTSLGMAGQPPLTIDLGPLPDHALVTDLVYVPLDTPLLAQARGRSLRTVDGLGMLLYQAVPGFEAWFGVRPAVTPQLRSHVVADIEMKLSERGE